MIGVHAMTINPNFAVVMAGVCRLWRKAVCTRPILWSHLLLGRCRPGQKIALWRERSENKLVRLIVSEGYQVYTQTGLYDSLEDLARHVRHF